MKIKTYSDAIENIFDFEIIKDYSLDKIIHACYLLGKPQDDFKIIHIAGTNGKGSVCKMLFSILKYDKKRVGVFTSPHIHDIRERFETHYGYVSKEKFLVYLNLIINLDIELAYFEKCFLIALLHFRDVGCEYAIIETGVGGRLDTTNIVNPIITCITSIGMDHKDLLGDTLEKIAYEKSGIIKKHIPVVVNINNNIIEGKAGDEESQIIYSGTQYKTNLRGDFQNKNAGLAAELAKYLGLHEDIIKKGLQNVSHKGRMEIIGTNMIVDGAHNEDGLRELQKFISTYDTSSFKEIYYCFSLKKGKSIYEVFDILGDENKYILIYSDIAILENMQVFSEKYEVKKPSILKNIIDKNPHNLYVIFGSLYMIGEFLD